MKLTEIHFIGGDKVAVVEDLNAVSALLVREGQRVFTFEGPGPRGEPLPNIVVNLDAVTYARTIED